MIRFFTPPQEILSRIPDPVFQIAQRLGAQGYQLYLVGGAIRDILQQKETTDWDLATDAKPSVVEDLFPCTVPLGRPYGTLLLKKKGMRFHLTSLRKPTIQEDLKDRDFTINSLAFDVMQYQLLDPWGGRRDIKKRLLRAIHPEATFRADPLRMLRLFRFVGQLNFSIHPPTYQAIEPAWIESVKGERMVEEMNRLLLSLHVDKGLEGLFSSGLLNCILPEFRCLQGEKKILHHIFQTTSFIPPTLVLRWAALLHDLGKGETRKVEGGRVTFHGHDRRSVELAQEILKRLGLKKSLQKEILNLIAHHMFPLDPSMSDRALLRFIKRVGKDSMEDLLQLRRADIMGTTGRFDLAWEPFWSFSQRIQALFNEDPPLSVQDLAVDGRDVMELLNRKEGPCIGKILEEALSWVMQDQKRNQKELLEEYIKSLEGDGPG